MSEEIVNVRYMVDDVQASIDFYTAHLDLRVLSSAAPAFADVQRGNLRLRAAGLEFRSDIITGPGGSQIVLDDPSGNPIELFQPAQR